ncbi:MAG: hypothetical protein BM564_07700 [Bacteroidetes bacterium MedPE-SWsnd-G2]|nr:MAG: hypothetical protein BM564_07700 [Bacteroidetes bacterium MedPE-SWsnd-G2]
MTLKHFKSKDRGYANHGWLKSYHTFSFADYYNPNQMNFGALRVLNDDIVAPKMGFGTHPHKNMEIISIPLKGALSHKDNMGNKRAIEENEVQVMSAGTGLTHSEFNDSQTDDVNFFQLWIIPEFQDVKPRYEQKKFDRVEDQIQLMVTPRDDKHTNTLWINQKAYISKASFNTVNSLNYNLHNAKNGVFAMVIRGEVVCNDLVLNERDAVGVWETNKVNFKSKGSSEILIIEVPML